MTEPVTDYDSKTVMLRAERGDTIQIKDGPIDTGEVFRRTAPYYGPSLILAPNGTNKAIEQYRLTSPGPQSQLMLWEPIEDNGARSGWQKWGEVTAELVETKKYNICEMCGEPIKNAEHQRYAMFGIDHA